jgi:plasmid replication initiation protein
MNLSKIENQQPNIITMSRQEFSTIEKRIVLFVINQMKTGFNINPDQFQNQVFTIPIANLKSNYNEIKQSCRKLNTRQITLVNEELDEVSFITPFPRVDYLGKSGVIKVWMFADVVPHFVELSKGYTKYPLEIALQLDSIYSQRMYEILCSKKDLGAWLNVDLEKLKHILNAEKYERYSHFKQRVLDIAQKELDEKANIKFTYEPSRKEGKKVTHLNFHILTEQELANINVEAEMDTITSLNIGQIMAQASTILATYNFSASQYKEIMTDNRLLQLFIEEDSKIAHGVRKDIKNKSAYMATVLGFGSKKKVLPRK